MTDPMPHHPQAPHAPEHASTHEHAGPNFQAYMVVFYVLCVCTALSFIVNWILGHNHTSAGIIMAIAAVKATLVAAIFMHLKYDWGKLYCIVVPVCILTVMMVIILTIDQVLVWHAYPDRSVPLVGYITTSE